METFPPFELTNLQRKYLGLQPVEDHWERVKIRDEVYVYFDGDVIRKRLLFESNDSYHEADCCERTENNRTILLPRTKRGKPRKLNYTSAQTLSLEGIYFYFSPSWLRIGNYTTQTTFYEEDNLDKLSIGQWLDKWVAGTSEKDLAELEDFKTATRRHVKYREGDFFTFKIGRNKWGFGRLVLNIAQRCKSEEFNQKHHGLRRLMGQALYIMIYRKISDSPQADIDELRKCDSFPTQAIMDNRFYYGEFRIIGNRPVEPEEWEPLLSYNETTVNGQPVVYLQYGLICKETTPDRFKKFTDPNGKEMDFSNEGIGFNIDNYSRLEDLITGKYDYEQFMWRSDLRLSKNREAKRVIFESLGLDADKSYAENLRAVSVQESAQEPSVRQDENVSLVRKIKNIFPKKP